MNKTTLKKKLQEMYLQALLSGFLDQRSLCINYSDKSFIFIDKMQDLESLIYGFRLDPGTNTTSKSPWKKAYKQYLEISETPLYKALKEEE